MAVIMLSPFLLVSVSVDVKSQDGSCCRHAAWTQSDFWLDDFMMFVGSPHQQDSCHSSALYEGRTAGKRDGSWKRFCAVPPPRWHRLDLAVLLLLLPVLSIWTLDPFVHLSAFPLVKVKNGPKTMLSFRVGGWRCRKWRSGSKIAFV